MDKVIRGVYIEREEAQAHSHGALEREKRSGFEIKQSLKSPSAVFLSLIITDSLGKSEYRELQLARLYKV